MLAESEVLTSDKIGSSGRHFSSTSLVLGAVLTFSPSFSYD